MPSGAKKRKAAKKKKELGAQINPSSNTSQGNDDVKSQDDKGSDSGELDSPASQNHPSDSNPFGEGNKEIQESSSSNAEVLSNIEANQKVGLASESKNGTVNESVEGSCADDRSSSSSSSDDESVDTTKKPEVLDGKTNDLVAPTAASVVYSVTPEVSASEETISVVETASVVSTAIPDMIASEKLEARLPAMNEVTNVPVTAPTYLSLKQNEDRDLHSSAHIKDSESPEISNPESEDQPLIALRPPVPQRTSWWNCCGLCDVFTGSNR